ncbi:MAG: glycoside hydrolase family 9 protein [Ruminococcus sp.]|nr:glycoside hydrolase family 9 protein [Ruminococcus sp.]
MKNGLLGRALSAAVGAAVLSAALAPVSASAADVIETEGLQLQTVLVDNDGKNLWTTESWGGQNILPNTRWTSVNIHDYYENGFVNFEVRNQDSAEVSFLVGLTSRVHGETQRAYWTSLEKYKGKITAGDDWKSYSLPIKELVDGLPDSGLDLDNFWYIAISGTPKGNTLEFRNVTITSTDDERQYPFIKVNQVGYGLRAPKTARVSYFAKFGSLTGKEWQVVNADTGEVAMKGIFTEPVLNDHLSGESVHIISFDDVKTAGTYYIRIPKAGLDASVRSPRDVEEGLECDDIRSFSFRIVRDVYADLLSDVEKYFYYQRQGIDLDAKYAGEFARQNLHPDDVKVRRWSDRDNPDAETFDVSQGWYDAGDFGKYTTSAASSINDILLAYELYPQWFIEMDINVPETDPENPLYAEAPPILSEAKWELDMLMKLEHSSKDGSFYVAANYSDGMIYLEDTLKKTCDHNSASSERDLRSHHATASVAAVMAHAYIVYKDIPVYRDFAEECLAVSERAWKWMNDASNEQHPSIGAANRTYTFTQKELDQEMYWAAGALFRAEKMAGKDADAYEDYLVSHCTEENITACFKGASVSYNHAGHSFLGFFNYFYGNESPDKAMTDAFAEFAKWRTRTLGYDIWGTTFPEWGYWWGSNRGVALNSMTLLLGSMILDGEDNIPQEVWDSNQCALDYLLGVNPLSFCYVSGSGENCVKNIYSAIYSNHAKLDPYKCPAGYVTEGTNYYNNRSLSKFDGKCYMDSDSEWTTNENTIYANATMLLLTAAVMEHQKRDTVVGDVNDDGEFSVADAVALSRWLLGDRSANVVNRRAGDLCSDYMLDTFDLIAMRKLLTGEM